MDEELGPQAKCPGIGYTDIECVRPPPARECGTQLPFRDLVAGFKFHVHFAQHKDIATDRGKVVEEAWKQLHEHGWGARLEASGQEACLKERVVAAAKKAVDKHVDFWIKNPNAPRGGEILKAVGDVFCSTVGILICPIIQAIKSMAAFMEALAANNGDVGKALGYLWEQFKKKLKQMGEKARAELTGLFEQFKSFLTIKDEKQFFPETGKFVEKVFTTVNTVVSDVTEFIGLPKLLAKLTGVVTAASIIPLLTPPVMGFAAVNLGARKLFEWLLPELVLGAGSIGALGNSPDAQEGEANGLFKTILDLLKKIAGATAGGLIGALVKDPKKREQIKAILEKIGDVAGKVEKSLGGVLALSRQVAKGDFDEVERALSGAASRALPEEIAPEQFQKMIGALLDFAGDEIWALLNPKLRDLVGKGLALFDKLFGLLRGAVVGGVGSIPFVGGVLGFALGLGLDLIVDLVKGFLIDQVIMPLAKFVLDDVIGGMKRAFDKRFFAKATPAPSDAPLTDAQRRVRLAVGRNPSLKALVGTMGDSVDGVRHTLKIASLQHKHTVSALVMTALKDVMLRGVASAEVREMVGGALAAMAPSFTHPGFSLKKGAAAVLWQIERPLGLLLGRTISNPRIRRVLRGGLAALVRRAGAAEEAARLGRSRDGVLGQLGIDLLDEVRPELAALLLGEGDPPALGELIDAELRGLAHIFRRDGFTALLAFGEHLQGSVSRAARKVAQGLIAVQADPVVRLALLENVEMLVSRVASRVLARPGEGLLAALAETAADSGAGGGR